MQVTNLSFLCLKYYSPLKEAPAKFYLSTIFGSSFTISSVAPVRLSTFYAYLITKIGNSNFKNFENEYINLELFATYIYETEMWAISCHVRWALLTALMNCLMILNPPLRLSY